MFPDGGISAVGKRAWASITKTCYIEFIPTKILCLHPSSTPPTPPSSKEWVLRLLRDCQQKQGERKQKNPSSHDLQLAKRLRQNCNRILSSYGTHGHRECKKKMHKKAKKRRMVLVLGFVAAVAMVNDLPDDIVRLHPRLDPLASSLLHLSVPVNLRQ